MCRLDVRSLYSKSVRSTVRPEGSFVAILVENIHFLCKEPLLPLLHHVSNESIISREWFFVNSHVLKDISRMHAERIGDLAERSKIFRSFLIYFGAFRDDSDVAPRSSTSCTQ